MDKEVKALDSEGNTGRITEIRKPLEVKKGVLLPVVEAEKIGWIILEVL